MPDEITVHYFAAARELCGLRVERVELGAQERSAGEVLALLAARHPRLAPYAPRMRLACNGWLAEPQARVRPGDEVSVLPPVAGGATTLCALRKTPLSLDEAAAAVSHPSAGGIAIFVGVVRDHAGGKPVARLDYEAHPTLAQAELARVLDEIGAEHPTARLCALHRVGQLTVGDRAVIVAASAPHRAEAFAACRAAIDRLKERVPIWKKEWAPDGSAHWVNLESP